MPVDRKSLRFLTLLALIFYFFTATVATAQMACAERSIIVQKLAAVFQENQVALGLDSGGRMIELFLSHTGSFTILVSYPNGQSCILATGQGWQPAGLQKVENF
jgi:hypothetical protein